MAGNLRATASFRLALRRYLSSSDRVVRVCGLTPRRHLLLLALEGAFDGRSASIGDLAEALGLAQSTTTELVQRAEEAGLVERESGARDGRVVEVRATEEGRRRLARTFEALTGEREEVARLATALARRGAR